MGYLSDRYVKIYTYRGYDICTLRIASPADGDPMGFFVDHKDFAGKEYNNPDDAFPDIDKKIAERGMAKHADVRVNRKKGVRRL